MNPDIWTDEAIWIYSLNLILGLAGSGIFIWWWTKAKKVSSIYAFITVLFLGTAVTSAVNLYARFALVLGSADYPELYLQSWWWPKRYFLHTGAMVALVFIAFKRAFSRRLRLPPCPCHLCEFRTQCDKLAEVLNCPQNGMSPEGTE
jgi:hypothetical protein